MATRLLHHRDISQLAVFALAAVCFTIASSMLVAAKHRPQPILEMQVALPTLAQVFLSGGDRFLAANTTVFRSLIASTATQDPARYRTQARLQLQAAWMNPHHEDNYYLAAAILSWNGQIDAAQQILARASKARPFDMLPAFFHGFNQYYFKQDPLGGVAWLQIAAQQTSDQANRINLQKIAAKWSEKGKDRTQALKLLESMKKQSRYKALSKVISQRAQRIQNLIEIDNAITKYRDQFHHTPQTVEDLVKSGHLDHIPLDPLNAGYGIDNRGNAQITATELK